MCKLIVIFMLTTIILSCESPPIEEPIEPVKCIYKEWQKEWACAVSDSFYFKGVVDGVEWNASLMGAVVGSNFKYSVGLNIHAIVPGDSCSIFLCFIRANDRLQFYGVNDTIYFRKGSIRSSASMVVFEHYKNDDSNTIYFIKEGDSLSKSNFITLDWINKDSTEVAGSFAFDLVAKDTVRFDITDGKFRAKTCYK